MRLSWLKIGSRVAILVIIYLLLSIPNTKYQYFANDTVEDAPLSSISDELVTKHISSILTYTDEEKSRQHDSLVTLLSDKLSGIKSEILDIDNPIIDSIANDFGLVSAIIGLSSIDALPLLETLWQWRQYLKQQSLAWDISNSNLRLKMASAIRFVSICEDFIVANRNLFYTKLNEAPTSLDPASTLSNIISGDLLLSADDISYSYLEQSKFIHELTPSLGLILVDGDSSYYISSSANAGLRTIKFDDFISRPFARRLNLRLRDDLPEIIANPAIPHQAAKFIYNLSAQRSIDYDFTLSQLKRIALCEIGMLKYAYEGQSLTFITTFSPLNNEFIYGLRRLGIRNEKLVSVSEIQYHPSIEVVGLQLSGEGIKIRNLEMAASAAGLATINATRMKSLRWRLPYYRILKGYSHLVGLFGNTPVIPNGMAPETALVRDYISTLNKEYLPLLVRTVAQFENENQYFPTYPILYEMARTNLASQVNR
jgi:hypothetical protein